MSRAREQCGGRRPRVERARVNPGVLASRSYVVGRHRYTFTALGKGHVIIDENGEDPAAGVAVSITKANPGVVQLSERDGDKHGLADGDVVVFEKVEGMVELNGGTGRPVKVINASSFSKGGSKH